jgi:preprotein translocase subunit SecE
MSATDSADESLPSSTLVAKSARDFRHRSPQAPPGTYRGGADPMAEGITQVLEGDCSMARTSPGEFIRQVRAEAGKVVWPTWPETYKTAIFVGILMVILAVFFLGIDQLFGWIMLMLIDLA